MKRLLLSLLVLLLAVPAYAGWNEVQKDTGGIVIRDGEGIEVPYGDTGLTVTHPDVSTASTTYVLSYKKGRIIAVYAVALTAFPAQSNAPTLTVSVARGNSYTDSTFVPISSATTLTSGSQIAMITDFTNGRAVSAFPLGNINVAVSQASVIAIRSDGDATSGTHSATNPDPFDGRLPATIIIIIE